MAVTRHRISHRAVLAGGVAVVLTAFAACGSNTSSTSSPSGATTTTSPSQGAGRSDASKTSQPPAGAPSQAPGTHPTEFNPPGDIPDNAVFVDHTAPGSKVHFSVPEGWAQTSKASALDSGRTEIFTDKYNSIAIQIRALAKKPTPASVKRAEIPGLKRNGANFVLTGISTVQRKHGTALHLTFLADSAPNPVTGKVVRDAVEQFDFWAHGQEAILTLRGPQNADNVDPWRIVSDSVQWR